jgi:hypothetical protein
MSFFHTTRQFKNRTKDVTRRLGWKFLRPGDVVMAVKKGQGLKPGEKLQRLGAIYIEGVRFEQLSAITKREVEREGYPDMKPAEFIENFCAKMGCRPSDTVTRIAFRRIPLGFAREIERENRRLDREMKKSKR